MAGFEGLAALCFNPCARRLLDVPGSCIDASVHLKHHRNLRSRSEANLAHVGYCSSLLFYFCLCVRASFVTAEVIP